MNHIVYWLNPDTLWHLAGRKLIESGFSATEKLAEAIQAANPDIEFWWAVADGTPIIVPFL